MDFKILVSGIKERNDRRLKYSEQLSKRVMYMVNDKPQSSTNEVQMLLEQIKQDAENLQMLNENIGSKEIHNVLSNYNSRISTSNNEMEKENLKAERDRILNEKQKLIQLQQNYKTNIKNRHSRLIEVLNKDPNNLINKVSAMSLLDDETKRVLRNLEGENKKIDEEIKNLGYHEIKQENEKTLAKIERKFQQLVDKSALTPDEYGVIDRMIDEINEITYDEKKKYEKISELKDKVNSYVNKYLEGHYDDSMSRITKTEIRGQVLSDLDFAEALKTGKKERDQVNILWNDNKKKNENINNLMKFLASVENFNPNEYNISQMINMLNIWYNMERPLDKGEIQQLKQVKHKISSTHKNGDRLSWNNDIYDLLKKMIEKPLPQPEQQLQAEQPQQQYQQTPEKKKQVSFVDDNTPIKLTAKKSITPEKIKQYSQAPILTWTNKEAKQVAEQIAKDYSVQLTKAKNAVQEAMDMENVISAPIDMYDDDSKFHTPQSEQKPEQSGYYTQDDGTFDTDDFLNRGMLQSPEPAQTQNALDQAFIDTPEPTPMPQYYGTPRRGQRPALSLDDIERSLEKLSLGVDDLMADENTKFRLANHLQSVYNKGKTPQKRIDKPEAVKAVNQYLAEIEKRRTPKGIKADRASRQDDEVEPTPTPAPQKKKNKSEAKGRKVVKINI